MIEDTEIFTPKELSARVKAPFRTILRAIRDKELVCVKFSASVLRITGSDANRWLQTLKTIR